MEIRKISQSYTPNFGILMKTDSVLEAASGHLFSHSGVEGYKEVFVALADKAFPGHLGFRGYAIRLGEQIKTKYPQIKKASDEIKEIVKNNPHLSRTELNKKITPIINRFEPEIDITL